ncbi:type 1 glutamine amidotransferase domain-containing protein [Pseudofrankia inefficax]|uniref:ThiJ/PfpI domain-containing protein n=1 Tax=Pseudofrankia inefficax (strain DSM 45817 / CECT 9037 / DDB 130130 / EuI1c) TaxID=298654 RepID=E3J8D2_PSEI1|nr:type 1 glutamine amidotransferase domain-containing protein [Pseudofrankia inefficax]ADP84466.1 ThiJ/PfpI domain-containing protein [Pseudofrankia inefficax]
MADKLTGQRIAFLVAPEGVEQVELTEPWQAVRDADGVAVLVSTKEGRVQAFNHLAEGDTFAVDETVEGADPGSFDALVLPGGVANPDFLRWQPGVGAFVRSFFDAGRPVAVICHGPWTLIDADVVRGRRLTSWPSLRADLTNAGATWVDDEVVIDQSGPNVLVSSRKPADLKAFTHALVDEFAHPGRGRTQPAFAGVSDQDAIRQVAGQTSADLHAADVFARESDGSLTATEAAKADGDDLTP